MPFRQLNKYEKELQKQDPEKARETIKLALKAMFEEKIRYNDNGTDGGNANAFLHSYWSALLAKNIKLEHHDQSGMTSLLWAISKNYDEVTLYLLNNGANPETPNPEDGTTPLIEAVHSHNVQIAKELISRGASIHTKDRYGITAFMAAEAEGVENEFSFLKPT